MNGVNRGIFRLLPVFLLLFLGVSSCSQKEERRILVIHSYEETYAAYPEFNRMIAEQFEKEKIDADIRTVYLDCESYWEEPELERMRFLVDSVTNVPQFCSCPDNMPLSEHFLPRPIEDGIRQKRKLLPLQAAL